MTSRQYKKALDEAITWVARMENTMHTKDDEAQFFRWLECSTLHRAAYIEAEQLWERGDMLADVPYPRDQSSLKKEKAKWMQPKVLGFGFTGIAMACSLMFAFVFVFNVNVSEHEVGYGQQATVALDDGSRVVLKANTKIRVEYNRSHRKITLVHGEAYFDVAKEKDRYFDVFAGGGVARALGTEFSVLKRDNAFTVTVVEGTVGVSPDMKFDKEESSVILVADQQLTKAFGGEVGDIQSVDAASETTWTTGKQAYRGKTLSEVVADLKAYHNKNIVIETDALAQEQVFAYIKLDDLESALKTITRSLEAKVKLDEDSQRYTLYKE